MCVCVCMCVRLVIDVELLEWQKGSGLTKMADAIRFLRKCIHFDVRCFVSVSLQL